MTNLKELQIAFQDYILLDDGEDAIDGMSGLPEIYRTAYWKRLVRILSEQFECLTAQLGEQKFKQIATTFLQKNPPSHFSLISLVENFSKYISDSSELSDENKEMACFEFLLREVTLGNKGNKLLLSDLSKIFEKNFKNVEIKLHPSVRLIRSQYNSPLKWQECHQILQSDASLYWMIWYDQKQSAFQSLLENEWLLLQEISKGQTFSALCEHVIAWFENQDEAVGFLVSKIQDFTSKGLFLGHCPER